MSELVANCPRCGSKKITFDLTQSNLVGTRYDWQRCYETFCICRHCGGSTVFVLTQTEITHDQALRKYKPEALPVCANDILNVEKYISQKDLGLVPPPDHLPENVKLAFTEGSKCYSIDCPNAAATMFRLCIDLATRPLLPEEDLLGLNSKTRRDLGLRLPWLFDNGRIPEALRELSICIREDGNDGAHQGTLTIQDAEDIMDFTFELLEGLFTAPKRLQDAKVRREARRIDGKAKNK